MTGQLKNGQENKQFKINSQWVESLQNHWRLLTIKMVQFFYNKANCFIYQKAQDYINNIQYCQAR